MFDMSVLRPVEILERVSFESVFGRLGSYSTKIDDC